MVSVLQVDGLDRLHCEHIGDIFLATHNHFGAIRSGGSAFYIVNVRLNDQAFFFFHMGVGRAHAFFHPVR
jgi:hypothetical protein